MDASILITVEKGVLTCTENFQKENVVFFLVEREKDELNTISFFNNCFFFLTIPLLFLYSLTLSGSKTCLLYIVVCFVVF